MTNKIILSCLMLIFCGTFTMSQEIHSFMSAMGSLNDVKKGSFSSSEAGFSVDLPKRTGGFSGVTGIEHNWRLTEGFYVAGRVERETAPATQAESEEQLIKIIDQTFVTFARDLFIAPPQVLKAEPTRTKFQGYEGLQARITMPDTICIIRVFWVENKIYKVGVVLTTEQQKHETAALKVFDSMKIADKIDLDQFFKQLIAKNTPPALPQTPAVKKLKSDAEDENLKGKVKSIFQQSKFTKGERAGTPPQKDSESYYNETGNLTRQVFYDDTNGYPYQIRNYGYLDGNRVSVSKMIEHEIILQSMPPPMMGSVARKVVRDERYDDKYVVKYAPNGDLLEKIYYDNAGKIRLKWIYQRKGETIVGTAYDSAGKVNQRLESKHDEKGDEIENVYPDSPMEGWTTIYQFKYEEFDKNGNWTKRTMTQRQKVKEKSIEKWEMQETRVIEYYP